MIFLLSLILGASGCGKSELVISKIGEALTNDTGRIYVIVPEQETIKTESLLLQRYGNTVNKRVDVINFSRLANIVFRSAGGITTKFIDNSGKDLICAVILERLKKTVPSFSKSADDIRFLQLLREEMDSLRNRGIHASNIVSARQKLISEDKGGESLSRKLDDFALTFSYYENSIKENSTDTTDDLVRLSDTLADFDFFENSSVFIDGFYDYTMPEYKIIEQIIKGAKNTLITFSLVLPDREGVFKKTAEAYNKIRSLAEKNGVEYTKTELTENHRTKNKVLLAVADSVMNGNKIEIGNFDGLHLVAVDSEYDECVFVAREIVKLAKNGVPLRNIAICSANIATYGTMLDNVLDQYGIAHLNCGKKSVVQMPVVHFVLSALESINSGFYERYKTEYLRSPYVSLEDEERFALINYISTWNITKKDWLSEDEWTLNPRGYAGKITTADKNELMLVNRAREKVFPSLKRLADCFATRSTVKEKSEGLVKFFDELELYRKVEESNFNFSNNPSENGEEISAWNYLLDALDTLVDGAGDVSVGKERYIKYMRLVLSDMSFGTIPSSLDEVEVGDVGFVRNRDIKHMFFIGFNEGVFPCVESKKSIFTESERAWLRDNDIPTDEESEDSFSEQTFHFLLALLRPSDSLCFIYHTSSKESSKAKLLPSYFSSYFANCEGFTLESFDSSFCTPVTERELEECLLNSKGELTDMLLPEYPELFAHCNKIDEFAKSAGSAFKIEGGYKDNEDSYYMSPSRLELYSKCHFAYFIKYMLNARTRKKAEFKNAEIGTFVHEVLEIVLKEISGRGEDIVNVTDSEIAELTKRAADNYILSYIPNINEKSPKYRYLISNICSFVPLVIKNIINEFSNSEFRPLCFEENLSSSELVKPYEIQLSDSKKLFFRGVIDRVDVYKKDGVEYVRVVDYKTKTGGKAFNLDDVLNGINTQMLIYLYAFIKSPSKEKRAAAGIMYMPAMKSELAASRVEEEESIVIDSINKGFRRSGMYLNDESIINAMEKGESKFNLSLKKDKDTDMYVPSTNLASLATLEEFGVIERYINYVFKEAVSDIAGGRIEANPIEDDSTEKCACSWCEYRPICRYEGEIRQKACSDNPIEEMKKILEAK